MTYEKSIWRGEFSQLTFSLEGRKAILVLPHKANETKRWLLKTEYFEAFQDLEYALVCKGYHLAYLENGSRWVRPGDLEAKLRLRDFLVREFGLKEKCVPMGMSCGGLHALKQASRYPQMVSVLCLDAPVVNLLSCPFGMGIGTSVKPSAQQELMAALGLSRSQMLAYRDHPLDHIGEIVAHRIPLLLMCGGKDTSVPFEENGQYLRDAYAQSTVPFMELFMPNRGHHPHGPDTPQAMAQAVEFIAKNDA